MHVPLWVIVLVICLIAVLILFLLELWVVRVDDARIDREEYEATRRRRLGTVGEVRDGQGSGPPHEQKWDDVCAAVESSPEDVHRSS